MLIEDARNESEDNSRQKRRYISPVLVRYGQVRDLTQAGSGTRNEYFYFGQTCVPILNNPTRKSCPSDRNVKENIVRIGEHPLGIGLYLFDYKPEFRDAWGHSRQFGVMAQEVETVMPEAVCAHSYGFKAVYYGMLGISREDH